MGKCPDCGAWDTLEVCSIDFPKQHLAAMLQRYTVRLLTQRQAFDTYTFRTYIQAELVLGPTLTTASSWRSRPRASGRSSGISRATSSSSPSACPP